MSTTTKTQFTTGIATILLVVVTLSGCMGDRDPPATEQEGGVLLTARTDESGRIVTEERPLIFQARIDPAVAGNQSHFPPDVEGRELPLGRVVDGDGLGPQLSTREFVVFGDLEEAQRAASHLGGTLLTPPSGLLVHDELRGPPSFAVSQPELDDLLARTAFNELAHHVIYVEDPLLQAIILNEALMSPPEASGITIERLTIEHRFIEKLAVGVLAQVVLLHSDIPRADVEIPEPSGLLLIAHYTDEPGFDSFSFDIGRDRVNVDVRPLEQHQETEFNFITRIMDLGGRQPWTPIELSFSSPEALASIALWIEAMREGLPVEPNWVADHAMNHLAPVGHTFLDGTSLEADFTGSTYVQNAAEWYYMKAGTTADIGTFQAWQSLERAGVLTNKGHVAILDRHFFPDQDYPPFIGVSLIPGEPNLNNATPSQFRHGDMVTNVGFGIPNNQLEATGPGGPVAEALIVHMPMSLSTTLIGWSLAAQLGIRTVSMSYGWYYPSALDFSQIQIEDTNNANAWAKWHHDNGILLVAAAHNHDRNLGEYMCVDYIYNRYCGEVRQMFPCEYDGILCVGGLDFDSKMAITIEVGSRGSNWHLHFGPVKGDHVWVDAGPGEVDIFAPWPLYWQTPVGTQPARASGTSASTPFVAGVATLLQGADPSITGPQMMQVLLDTAHTDSPDSRVPRTINAWAAVTKVLCPQQPSATILSPFGGQSFGAFEPVTFNVLTEGRPSLNVRWVKDDQVIGTGTPAQFSFSPGTHTITAEVRDACWQLATASRTIQVTSGSLVVPPPPGTVHPPWQAMEFEAVLPHHHPPCGDVEDHTFEWSSNIQGLLGRGAKISVPLEPGEHVITFQIVDDGCPHRETFPVEVGEGDPPVVTIATPLDDEVFPAFPDGTGTPTATVQLQGSATTAEGDPISDQDLRWVITVVEGAPPATYEQFGENASEELPAGEGCQDSVTYEVVLEATAPGATTAQESVMISVNHVCPQ